MLLVVLLLNQSCGFWQGERRKTGFLLCLWFGTLFPSSSFTPGTVAFSANEVCKGFCDLLEICLEAYYYCLFPSCAWSWGALGGRRACLVWPLHYRGGLQLMQNMRNPVGAGSEFCPEDVILSIFHLFYYL